MPAFEPRVDEYIDKAAPFAKPVLEHLRNTVHQYCPDAEEAIKWGFPNFTYKGKILCSMAAFKKHCTFGFWLEKEMKTMQQITKDIEKNSMFSLGKIKKTTDLPNEKLLKAAIEEATALIDAGFTLKKSAPSAVQIEVPDDLRAALQDNPEAEKIFSAASPSFRKEYITWLIEAKTEATRTKRLLQAVEWISEGKARHWKYEQK